MKRNRIFIIAIILLAVVSIALGYKLYQKQKAFTVSTENNYNMAFFQLVDYTQNVKTYLAKSLISSDSTHAAETLTHVWQEANLAETYLGMIPLETQELEKTAKFLNQVSEYSYTLSRKNIKNEDLTEEDLNNLKELYEYSIELSNVLNQLSEDINTNRIKWKDLKKDDNAMFAKEVSNISQDSFAKLEENFHEYSGLIYDGAFSDHITTQEKKGLTGDEISEEEAKQKAEEFIGKDKIKEIESKGLSEDGEIATYTFFVKSQDDDVVDIAISKKGGHVVYMNSSRNVNAEILEDTELIQKANNFLKEKGYNNMKETYFLKENGSVTINFAYEQNGVTIYPDLIKVKIAMDDGEILGIETSNYLNCHYERKIPEAKISEEEILSKINEQVEVNSKHLAIIPTKWSTEIFCYEIQGKVDNIDFLAYFNAETGREEDILIITNTPNGTVTE